MHVAVIGAAGYLGRYIVSDLCARGHHVSALCRESGRPLLAGSGVVEIATRPTDLQFAPDVLINLAYPTSGPAFARSSSVLEIKGIIDAIKRPSTTVIHISTMAVFGYELDRPVQEGPVGRVRDHEYIESKALLEDLLIADCKPQETLRIVRLGNIWGPASQTWTCKLIDRVLYGEPVRCSGEQGFSNVTDVRNASAFICHLAERPKSRSIEYFHVAEFSTLSWDHWIRQIESYLEITGTCAVWLPEEPRSTATEVAEALRVIRPGSIGAVLWRARRSGSYLRSLIRHLPRRIQWSLALGNAARAVSAATVVSDEDARFLRILRCRREFKTSHIPDWKFPVSAEESWQEVEEWMTSSGYESCRLRNDE